MARNTKCHICEERLGKVEIGLNKKLIDKKVWKYYCLSCFASYLDVTSEELLGKVEEFKEQGCDLFK
jgi:hypothetical protein